MSQPDERVSVVDLSVRQDDWLEIRPEDLDIIAAAFDETLVAADGAITGAMIALVPSPEDVERLALAGGEASEDLHLTLIYLGEAADWTPEDRAQMVAWGKRISAQWDYVSGEAIGVAELHPNGDEPCVVMVCSGEELAEFHETTVADMADMFDGIPTQYQPWLPHVTLFYQSPDVQVEHPGLQGMRDKTGPVTFDRLRLAFAGDVVDLPFGQGDAVASPSPEAVPQSESGDEDATASEPVVASSQVESLPDERVSAYDLAQTEG
jgi:2'-5' RNA ligase